MKTILVTVIFVTCLSGKLRAQQPLPENYLSIPVLITLENGSSGSGFFISSSNHFFLATAGHVLFDKKSRKLQCNQANVSWHVDAGTNHSKSEFHMLLDVLEKDNNIRLHPTHDVAIVRLGAMTPARRFVWNTNEVQLVSEDIMPAMVSNTELRKLQNVVVGDEVYVFGYPSSIGLTQLPQFDYSRPLLRKGIISGIYDKAQTIVIDASVNFGNSGGPVSEKQEVSLGVQSFTVIGVVSEQIGRAHV